MNRRFSCGAASEYMVHFLLIILAAIILVTVLTGCTNYSPTDSQLDKILGTIMQIVAIVIVPLVGWWINKGSRERSEDVKRTVAANMEAQACHVVEQTQNAVQDAAQIAARSAVGAQTDDGRRDRRKTDKPVGDG